MTEVKSFLKERIECGCGCGRYGPPRRKPWADDILCTTNCDKAKCAHCRGAGNRAKGKRGQRMAAKSAGVTRHAATHEESFRGALRMEVKADRACQPAVTAFMRLEAQAEAARAVGDPRPFMAAVKVEKATEVIYMFRASQVDAVVTALAENLWGV